MLTRGRHVEIELALAGVEVWRFTRPSALAQLEWMPLWAELREQFRDDEAKVQLQRDTLQAMIEHIALHLIATDGDDTRLTAAEVAETLGYAEILGLWAAFFSACRMGPPEKKVSSQRAKPISTPRASMTARPASTRRNGRGTAITLSVTPAPTPNTPEHSPPDGSPAPSGG